MKGEAEMSEKIAFGFVGELTYNYGLKLNGEPLVDVIRKYLRPIDPHWFGAVDIKITFHDAETCSYCESIVIKRGKD